MDLQRLRHLTAPHTPDQPCILFRRGRDGSKNRQDKWLNSLRPQPFMVDPEQEAKLSDSIGIALLVILETLTPAERLAFVLHDIFAVPFEEIAPIVERSEATTRQLASRARRRIRGGVSIPNVDIIANRAIVDAFLAASRAGDFEALLAFLFRYFPTCDLDKPASRIPQIPHLCRRMQSRSEEEGCHRGLIIEVHHTK